jgi:hypothetical protein
MRQTALALIISLLALPIQAATLHCKAESDIEATGSIGPEIYEVTITIPNELNRTLALLDHATGAYDSTVLAYAGGGSVEITRFDNHPYVARTARDQAPVRMPFLQLQHYTDNGVLKGIAFSNELGRFAAYTIRAETWKEGKPFDLYDLEMNVHARGRCD